MKLRELRALRGPNFWSQKRHKLMVMKLDIGDYEYKPTNTIDGFYTRLKTLLPSLHNHACSEGHKGGFFDRVRDGTWMGHVIEHIAIEIQFLAGMPCSFGKTRRCEELGVYNVIFEYTYKEAGLYAAKAAIKIAEALADRKEYSIEHDIKALILIRSGNMLGPSTQSLVDEAKRRNIPIRRLDNDSLVLLGQGKKQKFVSSSIISSTSCIGVDIACNKDQTRRMLEDARIPIAKGRLVHDEETLFEAARELGYPLVVKPVNGNHGRGSSINITAPKELVYAFHKAQKVSNKVIVEMLVKGSDFRMLLVDYKFVAATQRIPAMVTGDGISTIRQLIENVNSGPNRGCGHEKELTKIRIDESTRFILKKNGYALNSVPGSNEAVFLKSTANLSTGGTGIDVTDLVHPYNAAMAERVARIIGLDVCGVDIMANCLTLPMNNNRGVVLEVNAEPGLRMHLVPTRGRPRNVARPIIEKLFPESENGRIPVTAITGTNGKTTTARLLAHLAALSGYHTGLTTTEGIYINGKLIEQGDCTGPDSAEIVLREPDVDFAVLECARGGILRAGLGFSNCDIGIVTNVKEDHLGLGDIHTLGQMASLKRVVPESISANGYAILNADDDHVYAMAEGLPCHIALFSMKPDNPRIVRHCMTGGLAAYLEGGNIVIRDDEDAALIIRVADIPLTFGGTAEFNIQNALAVVLAACISDFSLKCIKEGLKSFVPNSTTIPGRMNLFNFQDFQFLVDYAHNPSSMNALGRYLKTIEATHKTGVITAVGDRRDQDIIELGRSAGEIFDEIIIKYDKDLRGRTRDEISMLLLKGINQIDAQKPVKIIPSELKAVKYSIDHARPGSFITALCAEVQEVINMIHGMMEQKGNAEKNNGRKHEIEQRA